MQNQDTRQWKVKDIERINASSNGNPRFRFVFQHGYTMVTAADYPASYHNVKPGDIVDVTFGSHYGQKQIADITTVNTEA